mmetsp:Transcript_4006/g.15975  ORF Transcript_4006/g.15975 Transcript_4006/m.15975 type:complete len:256 (+) Transcript_4006:1449-2216(+)
MRRRLRSSHPPATGGAGCPPGSARSRSGRSSCSSPPRRSNGESRVCSRPHDARPSPSCSARRDWRAFFRPERESRARRRRRIHPPSATRPLNRSLPSSRAPAPRPSLPAPPPAFRASPRAFPSYPKPSSALSARSRLPSLSCATAPTSVRFFATPRAPVPSSRSSQPPPKASPVVAPSARHASLSTPRLVWRHPPTPISIGSSVVSSRASRHPSRRSLRSTFHAPFWFLSPARLSARRTAHPSRGVSSASPVKRR